VTQRHLLGLLKQPILVKLALPQVSDPFFKTLWMRDSMLYDLLKPWLFKLSAETAHDVTLDGLSAIARIGLGRFFTRTIVNNPVNIMGIQFKNPVGLAAGLDKNGDHLEGLGQLGFGFIELGTVTPKAQSGNPKPRLFRVPEHQGIINRMGFNNNGLTTWLQKLATVNIRAS
jgi:dihydroorotate dehydrogenase